MSYWNHLYLRTEESRMASLLERLEEMESEEFATLLFSSPTRSAQRDITDLVSAPEWVVTPRGVTLGTSDDLRQPTLGAHFASSEPPNARVFRGFLGFLEATAAELATVSEDSKTWERHRWVESGESHLVSLGRFYAIPTNSVWFLDERVITEQGDTERRYWANDEEGEVTFEVAVRHALEAEDYGERDHASVIARMLAVDTERDDDEMLDELLRSPDRRTATEAWLYPALSLAIHFDAVFSRLLATEHDEAARAQFVEVLNRQSVDQRTAWFAAFEERFPGSAAVLDGLPNDLWVMTACAVVEEAEQHVSGTPQ